jgi:TRAP-type C4-dicarboxylate transport system substrate-binding protein
MNREKWNTLPADIQKNIETIDAEWAQKTGKLWDEVDKSGKEFSLKLGNKIMPLSKEENQRWARAVKPVLEEYVKRMKEKGLPGEEALKFCLEGLTKR